MAREPRLSSLAVTTRFLCTDPEWAGGTAPDCLLTSTIYSGQRFVARPDLWPAVGHTLNLGLDVALVIARESGDPAQYADWATSDWMLSRVHWFIGNEMTSTGAASWTMDPTAYRALWQACRVLHGQRWVGGLADGDPTNARAYLQPDAAGLGVHVYTLNPTDARNKTLAYQALGVKVWIGETHPADRYKLADYQWPTGVNVNDFCYSSLMVDSMGLYL